MPFTQNQTEDRSELRDGVYGWGKLVTRRAVGEAGPGLDRDFDSMESLAVDMAQTRTRGPSKRSSQANSRSSATSRLALSVHAPVGRERPPNPGGWWWNHR